MAVPLSSFASPKLSFHHSTPRLSKKPSARVRSSASGDGGAGAGIASPLEEGELPLPRWAGETPMSRLVGALISFKPLFSLMKLASRQLIIRTAENSNVPWREMTREILESDVYKEMESIVNPSIVYPDYYLKPFHAYDEGNLCWLAAAEAEQATMSVAKRAVPTASSVDEAFKIVRGIWINAIEDHCQVYSRNSSMNDILDIGCSIGVSTRCLADKFPSANITGLDLSPYFLSVAKYNEKKWNAMKKPVKWIHANGESTGLPSRSYDLVSLAYVLHECPAHAITRLIEEAYRLLRPGGIIVLTDNSPKSKVLQELPPVLFTLLKSTEPHIDEYYLLDLEKVMRETGFVNIRSVLTDQRHRTVTASVPL